MTIVMITFDFWSKVWMDFQLCLWFWCYGSDGFNL